ncbi:Alpha carbonic anhydrase 1, chloroplastic [Gracilariopsis chorda]|uniref:carbonic anhydrase n=1 Tax=Gracilariopsis chorda TaxID=448386 RepID=A0A2V3IZF8_9FLOR|nr:Alpha carbonic anhydrase 1, chloroplastic [Gracilariopsis chorda]|eukprot:PXF47433.1 Alpha carbonic anhydrase 1, chloroplastic [Gracilariopsis chorda]
MKSLYTVTLFSFILHSAIADELVVIQVDTKGCPVKSFPGEYSYDRRLQDNPSNWGDLKEEFAMCKHGVRQSPIDFHQNVKYERRSEGPQPNIKEANMTMGSGPFNWALSCSDDSGSCGTTTFGGKTFQLINIHFHSPSEHTLLGKAYPVECHLVHASEDGDLLVLGSMFEYADDKTYSGKVYQPMKDEYGDNDFITSIMNGVKDDWGEWRIDMRDLINHNKGYCSYIGSLTTPPCTEDVTWFMSMKVNSVSRRQVHEYARSCGTSIEGNHRPLQPINGRDLTCYVM